MGGCWDRGVLDGWVLGCVCACACMCYTGFAKWLLQTAFDL